MGSETIERVDLARSAATVAPRAIAHHQVLEHGLRVHNMTATRDEVVAMAKRDG